MLGADSLGIPDMLLGVFPAAVAESKPRHVAVKLDNVVGDWCVHRFPPTGLPGANPRRTSEHTSVTLACQVFSRYHCRMSETKRNARARQRDRWREAGCCITCGQAKDDPDRSKCEACLQAARDWWKANPDYQKDRRAKAKVEE